MDGPLFPAWCLVWALGLMQVLSIVQLWRFIAYQRTEAYRSKKLFPPTFANYPYPSINRSVQGNAAKQFERTQRLLIALLISVYMVGFAFYVYTYRVSADNYPLLSIISDSSYCLIHIGIWLWFTFRRYSSRSASHDDSRLWLFNMAPKTNAFVDLWLRRTALETCTSLLLAASAV
ncbi:hypothetical protein H4R35_006513, partial [Dimargaris xerosporica]